MTEQKSKVNPKVGLQQQCKKLSSLIPLIESTDDLKTVSDRLQDLQTIILKSLSSEPIDISDE